MKNIFKELIFILFLAVFVLSPMGCREDNFIEPSDPFEQGRLEPNPAAIRFNDKKNPIVMKTNNANITETPDGIRIQGSVYTENQMYGDTRLVSGDFIFLNQNAVSKLGKTYSSEHGDLPLTKGSFLRVVGDSIQEYSAMAAYGILELPAYGMLSKISAPFSYPGAKIVIGYGSKIKEQYGSDFSTLNDDRNYYVFQLDQGFGFDIGAVHSSIGDELDNSSVSVGVGNSSSTQLVVDPSDPFLFFRGSFGGISILGVEGGAFGLSVQGNINWSPETNYFGKIPSFDHGNIYFEGEIPIPIDEWIPGLGQSIAITVPGNGAIAFTKGDILAPQKFFDLEDTRYSIGVNGGFTISQSLIPYIDLGVTLATASIYLNYEPPTNFQFTLEGFADPLNTPEPMVLLLNIVENIMKEKNLPSESISLLKVIKVTSVINPLEYELGLLVSLGSEPGNWAFATKEKLSLVLPEIGELGAAKTRFELSPEYLKYYRAFTIGPFAAMEMSAIVDWTNAADFTISGHAWTDVGGEWGPVGFNLDMEMLAEIYKRGLVFGFHGLINLDGSCWVTILKKKYSAGAKFRLETTIQTDGTFQLSFRIGIGPFGYTVVIDYSILPLGQMQETITMREIPIDQVPVEHRYTPEQGEIILPADYVHDYQTEYTTERTIIMENQ